ncbi:hypothetical protein LCGC14_3017790, partial [marine sediment metagenome]
MPTEREIALASARDRAKVARSFSGPSRAQITSEIQAGERSGALNEARNRAREAQFRFGLQPGPPGTFKRPE